MSGTILGHVETIAHGPEAAETVKQILVYHIFESARIHRLLIICSTFLLALAALIPAFAPEGRQTPAVVVSLGLLVFALGAIGVTSFRLRALGADIEAKTHQIVQRAKARDSLDAAASRVELK